MTTFKVLKVGKPLTVDELTAKPASRRRVNPRDEELAKLVIEVAAGPRSQVLPWRYEGKLATARLAAKKAIQRADVVGSVYASTRVDHEGVILFSRVPLRGGRKSTD